MTTRRDKGLREQANVGTQDQSKLPAHYTTFTPPDYSGYLTDDQLADLGRLKIGLHKIGEFIERVNSLAAVAKSGKKPPDKKDNAMRKHGVGDTRITQSRGAK